LTQASTEYLIYTYTRTYIYVYMYIPTYIHTYINMDQMGCFAQD